MDANTFQSHLIEKDLIRKTERIEILKRDNEQLQFLVQSMKIEFDKKMELKANECIALKVENERYTVQAQSYEDQLAQSSLIINELKRSLADKAGGIDILEQNIQGKLSKLSNRVEQKDREIRQLKDKLKESKCNSDLLSVQSMQQFTSEKDQLYAELASEREIKRKLSEQLTLLKSEMESLRLIQRNNEQKISFLTAKNLTLQSEAKTKAERAEFYRGQFEGLFETDTHSNPVRVRKNKLEEANEAITEMASDHLQMLREIENTNEQLYTELEDFYDVLVTMDTFIQHKSAQLEEKRRGIADLGAKFTRTNLAHLTWDSVPNTLSVSDEFSKRLRGVKEFERAKQHERKQRLIGAEATRETVGQYLHYVRESLERNMLNVKNLKLFIAKVNGETIQMGELGLSCVLSLSKKVSKSTQELLKYHEKNYQSLKMSKSAKDKATLSVNRDRPEPWPSRYSLREVDIKYRGYNPDCTLSNSKHTQVELNDEVQSNEITVGGLTYKLVQDYSNFIFKDITSDSTGSNDSDIQAKNFKYKKKLIIHQLHDKFHHVLKFVQRDLDHLNTQLNEQSQILSEKDKEIEHMSCVVSEKDRVIELEKENSDRLKSEALTFKEKLMESEKSIEVLHVKIKELAEINERDNSNFKLTLDQEKDKFKAELQSLSKEYENNISIFDTQIKEAECRYSELEEKFESTYKEYEVKLNKQRSKNGVLKDKVTHYTTIIKDMEGQLKEFSQSQMNYQNQIAKLMFEIKNLKSFHEVFQKKNAEFTTFSNIDTTEISLRNESMGLTNLNKYKITPVLNRNNAYFIDNHNFNTKFDNSNKKDPTLSDLTKNLEVPSPNIEQCITKPSFNATDDINFNLINNNVGLSNDVLWHQ